MQIRILTNSKSETIAAMTAIKALGYTMYSSTSLTVPQYVEKHYAQYPYPLIDTTRKDIELCSATWSLGADVTRKEMSLSEALIEVVGPARKTSVKINGTYTAVANKDFTGVDVGCTFVRKDTVKEILDMLENKGEVK